MRSVPAPSGSDTGPRAQLDRTEERRRTGTGKVSIKRDPQLPVLGSQARVLDAQTLEFVAWFDIPEPGGSRIPKPGVAPRWSHVRRIAPAPPANIRDGPAPGSGLTTDPLDG